MNTTCQECGKKALAKTKKNARYRVIADHDLCPRCEKKFWDRARQEKERKEEEDES